MWSGNLASLACAVDNRLGFRVAIGDLLDLGVCRALLDVVSPTRAFRALGFGEDIEAVHQQGLVQLG